MRCVHTTLRMYIREVLEEAGWEDPEVVVAKKVTVVDDPTSDDEGDPDDTDHGSRYRINKSTHDTSGPQGHDSYANANNSLSSMKPVAPRQSGGPQSGRSPGSTRAGTSRSYSAGY